MSVTTKAEVIVILERLRNAYYPHPELKKETISIYAEMLAEEFDAHTLAAAALVLPKRSKWWPAIAEIREACLEVSGDLAQLPAVGEAYREARRAAARIGAYTKPVAEDFSHAIVHRAALQAAGSWRRWCLTDEEAPLRARFFECFRDLRARELARLALPESARQLTAEESRELLEDITARAEREQKLLPAGRADGKLKPIRELMRSNPPPLAPREVRVGADLSESEWNAKKRAILEAAGEAQS